MLRHMRGGEVRLPFWVGNAFRVFITARPGHDRLVVLRDTEKDLRHTRHWEARGVDIASTGRIQNGLGTVGPPLSRTAADKLVHDACGPVWMRPMFSCAASRVHRFLWRMLANPGPGHDTWGITTVFHERNPCTAYGNIANSMYSQPCTSPCCGMHAHHSAPPKCSF